MEWMFLPLKRYAQFSGRSRRKEYWMWVLFTVLAGIVLGFIDRILGLGGRSVVLPQPGSSGVFYSAFINRGLLANLFTLATIIPSLAVSVRRLHDTNRTGWWLLLPVLPYLIGFVLLFTGMATANQSLTIIGGVGVFAGVICAIVLLVWYCTAGTPGPNDYGDDPLSDTPEELARTFE
ncbi:DUF805 domain-containing protein [Sphingomonas oligophenolica]|uniref:DUF805 domain-containing protein n=1 Tax=Sphingomonas oligophenolica TaxID=301154 RepID=A0ABU9Y060_9SPHN